MELLLLWIAGAIVVGIIAGSRNRSGFGWFLLSLLISPLLTLILVALLPGRPAATTETKAPDEPDARRRCPHCAELIRVEAQLCRFCGRPVDPSSPGNPQAG